MQKEYFKLDFLPELSEGLNGEKIDDSRVGGIGMKVSVPKKGGFITLRGEAGMVGRVEWTKDKFLIIPIFFEALHSFYFSIDLSENPNTSKAHMDIGIMPFISVKSALPLKALNLETLFLPRTPGRLKNTSTGTPQKPEKITYMRLYIPASATESEILFGLPYLSDKLPTEAVEAKPQIDELGQWNVKEWKGKTKNLEELKINLKKQADEHLDASDFKTSKYGGDLSMKREATGWFRTHFEDGKWWLCDPDGYLFYSSGIDCITPHSQCPVKGIEALFSKLPEKEGVMVQAWNKDFSGVSYSTANLIQAFGENWHEEWMKITAKRIKAWGFNTIANWSETEVGMKYQIPYMTQTPFPSTKECIFRDFPDVFSVEYQKNAEDCAQFLQKYKDDRYLIGYFMRNEPMWAFGVYNLAGLMLEKESNFASKEKLILSLKEKYGDIKAFNESWSLNYGSFDELKKPIEAPWTLSENANEDLKAFTRSMIDEYIRVPAAAYRRVDKSHLNLGMRWAWIASDDFYAGCKYSDVFSINCYQVTPDVKMCNTIYEKTGLPLMIGEFQIGALDVGLPANGLCAVTNQEERGKFYSFYMENGAKIPQLVGAHYFQWSDQPALGRFDGENLNIGLVDICDTPYEPFVHYAKMSNEKLTAIHARKTEPTDVQAQAAPKEGF